VFKNKKIKVLNPDFIVYTVFEIVSNISPLYYRINR